MSDLKIHVALVIGGLNPLRVPRLVCDEFNKLSSAIKSPSQIPDMESSFSVKWKEKEKVMKRNICTALASTIAVTALLYSGSAISECSLSGASERYALKGKVVIDNETKLVWARCSVGQRWSEATAECAGNPLKSTYDNATKAARPAGWRLPTPDELKTIVAENCQNPSIDSDVFPGTAPDPYWAVDDEGCWIVNFGPGATYGPNSYLCGYGNVSAVRLIQE